MLASQKGYVNIVLSTEGKAVHSGYPEHGINALKQLMKFLNRLEQKLSAPSIEASMNYVFLDGGKASNIVPDRASAELSIRTTTSVCRVLRSINRLRTAFEGKVSMNVRALCDPVPLYSTDEEKKHAGFTTDVCYLFPDRESMARVVCGPGNILAAHTNDEYVRREDLFRATDRYQAIVNEYFTRR